MRVQMDSYMLGCKPPLKSVLVYIYVLLNVEKKSLHEFPSVFHSDPFCEIYCLMRFMSILKFPQSKRETNTVNFLSQKAAWFSDCPL